MSILSILSIFVDLCRFLSIFVDLVCRGSLCVCGGGGPAKGLYRLGATRRILGFFLAHAIVFSSVLPSPGSLPFLRLYGLLGSVLSTHFYVKAKECYRKCTSFTGMWLSWIVVLSSKSPLEKFGAISSVC